jgi:DNA-binding XRE family transcriptional regulator
VQNLLLTERERVYLWRRRRGLRQEDLAKRVGIHPDTLGERERGLDGKIGGRFAAYAAGLKPEPWETAVVMRRRKGLSQTVLAKKLGVTKPTIIAWEQGRWEWTRLAEYWGIRY